MPYPIEHDELMALIDAGAAALTEWGEGKRGAANPRAIAATVITAALWPEEYANRDRAA